MICEVKSPKAGKIFKISVKTGEEVKIGQYLLVLETKKGNMEIKSPFDGIVEAVTVAEGDEVEAQTLLVKIALSAEKSSDGAAEKTRVFEKIESEITVIGGGPGGYVAAIKAAKMGANVVLVEKESLGGTCLNRGCIPTKALVRSAELFDSFKEAEEYGLSAVEYKVDMEKVIKRKDSIVERLVGGVQYLVEKNGIKLINGTARFEDKNTVIVEGQDKITQISSKSIIIATGSDCAYLPIPGAHSKVVSTSTEMLDVKNLPKKIAILGAGVVAIEFAFIYASFGSEVSVILRRQHILRMLDQDVIDEITAAAEKKGIKLYTCSKMEEIFDTEDGKGIVKFSKDGESRYLPVDKVMMAVGRIPYLEGLQIDKAGVELNESGQGIKVNTKMQTNVNNIYAIGDVTDINLLAHVASHQGIVAVENIMGHETEMDYSAVPCTIFTHPEIATVGLTEQEARSKGMDVEIGKFPYAANGKSLAMGDDRGFIKVLKDKGSNKIVGASIIGINAADLIASLTIAIRNGLTSKQLAETIFAHPTTAEVIHEGILSVEGGALHFAE